MNNCLIEQTVYKLVKFRGFSAKPSNQLLLQVYTAAAGSPALSHNFAESQQLSDTTMLTY